VCVCTRLSIASIHFHLSLLSLPFSSGLLKNSAHNLSIFGGDTFSFMGGILILDKFLEVKKKKLHIYTKRKQYICTQMISRPAFFLTLVCVLEVFQLGLLDVILYHVNYVFQRPETFSCEQFFFFQFDVQVTVMAIYSYNKTD